MARESHIGVAQPTAEGSGGEVPSLAPAMPRTLDRTTQEIPQPDMRAAPLVAEAELLIGRAREADADTRARLAEHLNACFEQMAGRGGSRATADFLVRQLESGALSALPDRRGRTARAAAVRALLSLGYPYALEVAPEDLEHLRLEEERAPRRRPAPFLAALAAGAVSVGAASLGYQPAAWEWAPLAAGLLVGGALAAWGWAGTRRLAFAKGLIWAVAIAATILVEGRPWMAATALGGALALATSVAPKRRGTS